MKRVRFAALAMAFLGSTFVQSPSAAAESVAQAAEQGTKAQMELNALYLEFHDPQFRAELEALGRPSIASAPFLRVADGSVWIDAFAEDDAEALLAELIGIGCQDQRVYKWVVSCNLPIAAIPDLETLDSLSFARPVASTRHAVLGQGPEAMYSDELRSVYGVDGTGITVGVISDSYDCLGSADDDIASGDLPPDANINVLMEGPCPATDEGRAMMQLVFDVAPGANLAFHSSDPTIGDFANGIHALAAAGADVIVDDIIYYDEPMFQDGILAQAVDEVRDQNVAYFSAAGNQARASYEGPFRNGGSIDYGFGPVPSHDFDPGLGVDLYLSVTIPDPNNAGGILIHELQWASPSKSANPSGSGAVTNLDMCLWDTPGAVSPIECTTLSEIGADPTARITEINWPGSGPATVHISIHHRSGPVPSLIKTVEFGSATPNEFDTSSPTCYGHANSAGAIAVGATRYLETPPFGQSPPLLESFSSAGGVPILYDLDDNPTHLLRKKPEIVAPDGTNTTFFHPLAEDPESDGIPNFFGTSAAAPHAAGVAALLLELNPSLTPDGISAALESNAIDMGTPGFDYDSGYGLIHALDTVSGELAVDFGTNGFWLYDGAWTALLGYGPDAVCRWGGGNVAAGFASFGFFNLTGGAWWPFFVWAPEDCVGSLKYLFVDFGLFGLWRFNGVIWIPISLSNPEGMLEANGSVYVDFGSAGVSFFDVSAVTWTSISPHDPEGMVPWDGGVALDFGAEGLWSYNGVTLVPLLDQDPIAMAPYASGLVASLAGNGTWYRDGPSWRPIHMSWVAEALVPWAGGLAADFGGNGLWSYNGGWERLSEMDPGIMKGFGINLAVDFPGEGLFSFQGPGTGAPLAPWNAEGLYDVNTE